MTELFAPAQSSVDAVRSWLESAGIAMESVSQSANKQWLQFDAKTSEAERLLHTQYHEYEHAATGKTGIACDEYHLPGHVQAAVDYITPGVKHLATRGSTAALKKRADWSKRPQGPKTRPLPLISRATASADLSSCGQIVTPACIAAMYNITQGTKASASNQLGIFQDLGDVYSQQDLDSFFGNYYPLIPAGTHPTLQAIDGAVAPIDVAHAGPESDLDFQIAYPIIWPQNSILFQTDDMVYENNYAFVGFLNNFLDAIDGSYCNYTAFGEKAGNSAIDPVYPNPQAGGYKGQLQCGVYKPTNVISISYGGQEASLPVNYQRRQCNEFMKLGLQGVSVVVSSRDSGVAGRNGDTGNANGCMGSGGKIFSPDFPATCPYLTTIGGTTLPVGASAAAGNAEVAVTRFPCKFKTSLPQRDDHD